MITTLLKTFLMLALVATAQTQLQAQGTLTPPGAPAPTMKTLTQVEPRTPVSAAGVISTPGSYYLTQDITASSSSSVLSITSGNVTLDLNGFSVANTASTGAATAFSVGAVKNVKIRNGRLTGGFNTMTIATHGTVAYAIQVEDVNFADAPRFALIGYGGRGIVIRRCQFKDCYAGISLGGAPAGIVDPCTGEVTDCVFDTTVNSVYGQLLVYDSSTNSSVRIERNHLTTSATTTGGGISANGLSRCFILNNTQMGFGPIGGGANTTLSGNFSQ